MHLVTTAMQVWFQLWLYIRRFSKSQFLFIFLSGGIFCLSIITLQHHSSVNIITIANIQMCTSIIYIILSSFFKYSFQLNLCGSFTFRLLIMSSKNWEMYCFCGKILQNVMHIMANEKKKVLTLNINSKLICISIFKYSELR